MFKRKRYAVLILPLILLTSCMARPVVEVRAISATSTSITTPVTTTTILSTITSVKIIVTRLPPQAASRSAVRTPVNWQRVADCESGARDKQGNPIPDTANWSINTGNGYFGGLQFLHSTWISNGGGQYSDNAHLTSRENQIAVASNMGLSHWPHCRRYA